jgi:hypothetical protein
MKSNRIFLLLLLLAAACAEPKKPSQPDAGEEASMTVVADTFSLSTIIPHVECKNNPALSYALYLPKQYHETASLPALIFADPHGDGALPLYMYSALAEKYGVILVGSNDSKNGVPFNQASSILQTLASESISRLNADGKEISFAGFSGGAKAAMVAASELSSIHTLIYCGAGMTEIPFALPPSLGITGIKDMNYTEVIETARQIENKKIGHALIEWNGKHEWSDAGTFENAFYWLNFRAMEKKIRGVDQKMVQSFLSANRKTEKDALKEEKRLLRLINFLKGVTDVTEYSRSLESFRKEQRYISAKKKEHEDLELEMRMKQNYIQCIELKDMMWWSEEVKNFRKSTNNPMNDRILGYISLACYSFSNNALKQHDLQRAEKFLGVYALVDPENADRAFMQACLYAQMNNKTGALQSIRESITYGLTDKAKLESEPSFASFRNSPEFNALLVKMN